MKLSNANLNSALFQEKNYTLPRYAIIWFLRIYKDGRYCTFPHAVEFLNKPYEQIFPIFLRAGCALLHWRCCGCRSGSKVSSRDYVLLIYTY